MVVRAAWMRLFQTVQPPAVYETVLRHVPVVRTIGGISWFTWFALAAIIAGFASVTGIKGTAVSHGTSVYAGLALWRIRPGAVRTAEIYLLCFLCYQGIAAVLPFLAGLPASANHGLTEAVYKNLTRGLLYFGLWYSYLNKSKRVKATYNALRPLSAPDLP